MASLVEASRPAALVRPVVHAVEASPPFEANIGEVADAGGVRVDFEKYVPDRQAHEIWVLRWYRIVPYRSYVKGWKISPSHYINQDLATVWLDK